MMTIPIIPKKNPSRKPPVDLFLGLPIAYPAKPNRIQIMIITNQCTFYSSNKKYAFSVVSTGLVSTDAVDILDGSFAIHSLV